MMDRNLMVFSVVSVPVVRPPPRTLVVSGRLNLHKNNHTRMNTFSLVYISPSGILFMAMLYSKKLCQRNKMSRLLNNGGSFTNRCGAPAQYHSPGSVNGTSVTRS